MQTADMNSYIFIAMDYSYSELHIVCNVFTYQRIHVICSAYYRIVFKLLSVDDGLVWVR